MKRSLFAAMAAVSVVFSGLSPVSAAPNSPELVVDIGTGQVIYADEATRPWYPASTTKMMTAYVALRAVKAGLLKLDTPLVASSRAAAQKPSKIGIRPGQEITLDNALKILMVKSANDLAVVIAEGVGGSVPNFAQMMNNEARRIGMRETNFVNPHGFHDPNHYTSARDLAVLARTMLFEFPEYRGYWGIGAVRLGNKVMKNTNGLIGRYPGAEGFKTGFVCASGFNLVGLANTGGRQVLAVVLGAASGPDRTIRAAQLLDKGASGWGGSYGSLTGLASVGGTPPNMRGSICTGKRMRYLTEEDSGGALMGASPTSDSSSVYAVGAAAPTGGMGGGGRAALGPRAELAAIQVYLGRSAGSTEIARGPGNGAVNGVRNTAAAFAAPAAASPVQRAAATTAARAKPAPVEDEAEEAPAAKQPARLLPGAITSGGPGAIGLRRTTAEPAPKPGAIAARPTGMEAARAAARPGAIMPKAEEKPAKADAKAKDKTGDKKVATRGKTDAKKADAKASDPKKADGKKADAKKVDAQAAAKIAAAKTAAAGAAKAKKKAD
jgi:D-alanyl-D-alanine carboxypeptidase